MAETTRTFAFLFTDIEGSTRLWDDQPAVARAVIARHDEILRGHLGERGTIFKAVGDGFCVAYYTATDALEASIKAARAIEAEPWPASAPIRVRFAVHAGEAELRDGDYFGATLNRTARILGIGHGGQILLSEVAAGLCSDALPEDAAIHALGQHRLRDLGRPERIYQVQAVGLPNQFPALRSLAAYATNLPTQVTSFIGREDELEQLVAMISEAPVVTIVGAGGSGKTRLALQVGAEMLDRFPAGVWFVELGMVNDPESVPAALASALGVREMPGLGTIDAIADHIAARSLLLILDNCEHVIESCAALASRLIQNCTNLRILCTSREVLNIQGERRFRVRSLTSPPLAENSTPHELSQFESIQLFLQRVLAVQPNFAITNENAPAVAELCHRLDGIPLAIELAAARVASMSVENVLERLANMFGLLVGGLRSNPPRHQTLRGLIDWSYQLLAPSEQQLLQRLSVFAAGWDLTAAETICAGDAMSASDLDLHLASLVEKNLVVYEESGAGLPYRLLESIRQFGDAELQAAGKREEVEDCFLEFYARYAEQFEQSMTDSRDIVAFAELRRHYPNCMAALEIALRRPNGASHARRLCRGIAAYWDNRALYQTAERICERTAEACRQQGISSAWALNERARFLTKVGKYPAALEFAAMAEAEAEADADLFGIAFSVFWRGACLTQTLQFEAALEYFERATALAETHGFEGILYSARSGLGLTKAALGDHVAGLVDLELASDHLRSRGAKIRLALTLNNLCVVNRDCGRLEEARAAIQEAYSILEGGELEGMRLYVVANIGSLAVVQRDPSFGRPFSLEALRIAIGAKDPHRASDALAQLACFATIERDYRLAATLFGSVAGLHQEVGIAWEDADARAFGPFLEEARRELGEEALHCEKIGAATALEDLLQLAERQTLPT